MQKRRSDTERFFFFLIERFAKFASHMVGGDIMEKIDVVTKEEMFLMTTQDATRFKYALLRVAQTIAWENEIVHDLPEIVKQRNNIALDEIRSLMEMLE